MLVVPSNRIIAPGNDQLQVFTQPVDVVLSPGSEVTQTIKDVIYQNSTTATVRKDLQIVGVLSPATNRKIQYVSSIPSRATVNQQGYVTSVGSGQVSIILKSPQINKRIDHEAGTLGGQTTSVFDSYVAGSLGRALNDEMDSRITGSSLQKNVFITVNNSTSTYVRNTNNWAGLDLTCWPVWSSSSGNRFNGCAISPRHMMFARHASPSTGSTIRFVTNDNQVVERTVGAKIDVGIVDLQIAVLNSDLPSSIKFAKVLPQNWQNFLTIGHVPILAGDQELKLLVRDTIEYFSIDGTRFGLLHQNSVSTTRLPLTETIISGDSGSPLFFVIDDEVVAIGNHFSANGCPLISSYWSGVNAAMTTLGGGYQLTPIDLSSYPNYGA